jgi:hypothetical protein
MSEYQLTEFGRTELIAALSDVWKARKKKEAEEKIQLSRNITSLQASIDNRVDAAIQPENYSIKDDILRRVGEEKLKLTEMQQLYEDFDKNDIAEKERFISFALERAEEMERYFFDLPKSRLLQCKQMLFPAGFWIDKNKKVYTCEMSILTRLASTKKDLPNLEKSFMVHHRAYT